MYHSSNLKQSGNSSLDILPKLPIPHMFYCNIDFNKANAKREIFMYTNRDIFQPHHGHCNNGGSAAVATYTIPGPSPSITDEEGTNVPLSPWWDFE